MRILGIVCSPRQCGNTEILVKEVLDSARDAGAQIELIHVAGKSIAPCDACNSCVETGLCKIKDDMQAIYEALERADGVVFGTPVYYLNVSAQAKAIIDRTYALRSRRKLRGKVAAGVVVARRVGAGQVMSLLYTFFIGHRMMVAGTAIGYGNRRGDVKEGPGGLPNLSALEEARAVGKNMVRLVEQLARGKT